MFLLILFFFDNHISNSKLSLSKHFILHDSFNHKINHKHNISFHYDEIKSPTKLKFLHPLQYSLRQVKKLQIGGLQNGPFWTTPVKLEY